VIKTLLLKQNAWSEQYRNLPGNIMVGLSLFLDTVLDFNLQYLKPLHVRETRDTEQNGQDDNCENNHSRHLVSPQYLTVAHGILISFTKF
jgi:hypothetical protein